MKKILFLLSFIFISGFSNAVDYSSTIEYKNGEPLVKTYYKISGPTSKQTCNLLIMVNKVNVLNPAYIEKIHSCSEIINERSITIYDVYNGKYQIISQKLTFSDDSELELRQHPSNWFNVTPDESDKIFKLNLYIALYSKFFNNLSSLNQQCLKAIKIPPNEMAVIQSEANRNFKILYGSFDGHEIYTAAQNLVQLSQIEVSKYCK